LPFRICEADQRCDLTTWALETRPVTLQAFYDGPSGNILADEYFKAGDIEIRSLVEPKRVLQKP
jgi:hypothetical protein